MRILNTVLILGCIIFLFFACSRQQKRIDRIGKNYFTMQELPNKSFYLDDSTTQVLSYIQTFVENDSLKLALYNKPMKNICIFDVKAAKVIDKIQLNKDGPYAINNSIMGFYYINKDSIYLYDYWTYKLLLVNHDGVILNKEELANLLLPDDSTTFVKSYPLPTSRTPIKKVGDIIILEGQNGELIKGKTDCSEAFVTALYNLKTKRIRFANSYPQIYGDLQKNIWSVFGYRIAPYDINNRQEMIVSFPADDHIVVYDLKSSKFQKYFAGYSKDDIIKPSVSTSDADMAKHVWGQTQYCGIFYDKWNELYYRIVAHPSIDYNTNQRKTSRPFSIIILDHNFDKIGEFDLKVQSNVYYSHSFVSSEGFHINIYSEDDDYLTFMTLKPKKI